MRSKYDSQFALRAFPDYEPLRITGAANAYPKQFEHFNFFKNYIMDYMNGLENSHMFITEYSVYCQRNSEKCQIHDCVGVKKSKTLPMN